MRFQIIFKGLQSNFVFAIKENQSIKFIHIHSMPFVGIGLVFQWRFKTFYYRPQTKFAKVMFLQASVCPQGGGVRGCSGGACVVAWGACMVAPRGGMHGCSGGHAWLLQGGHAWLLRGACMVARGGVHGCSGGVHGCSQGGMHGCSGGACMVAWGAWLLGGVRGCSRGGMHGCSRGGHVWLLWGGCAWLLGGACVVLSMRYGQ